MGSSLDQGSNDIYFIEPKEIDDDDLGALSEPIRDQIGWGKTYWELLGKHCKHHKGESRDFPHNEASLGFPPTGLAR